VGELSRGHEFLQRLLEARRLISPVEEAGAGNGYPVVAIGVVARTYTDLDGVDDAQLAAQAILSSDLATPIFRQMANFGLGILAVIAGDPAEAKQHYDALIPTQGTLFSPACMSTDRILGLLAQTMSDPQAAVGHFQDALVFCRKAGYQPELAWTCCDYADALAVRSGQDDRKKIRDLLDEALDISTKLGMRPLMERVSKRLEWVDSKPGSAASLPRWSISARG